MSLRYVELMHPDFLGHRGIRLLKMASALVPEWFSFLGLHAIAAIWRPNSPTQNPLEIQIEMTNL